MNKRKFTRLAALVLAGASLPVIVAAQAAARGTMAELAQYEGADRMAKIIAAAKKEGTLTLYTTIGAHDLPSLIKPFEVKYGIKVNIWRTGTEKVLQRTLAEAAANLHTFDVVHFGSPEMEALSREKLLQPVNSPAYRDLLPGSVPAHREWAATMLTVFVQAYNTNLIRKEDLPKTYQDLLDPKWKGKLGIEANDSEWFASVVEVMGGGEKGLAFFRALVARNGVSVRTGHALLTNLVAAGEVPMALTVHNYTPEQVKKKGAPIDWFALEPAIARANAIGVARHAPHPAAALLFHEHMLTDAQPILASLDYVPTNTKLASPLKGVKILTIDPNKSLDEIEKWTKLFGEIVVSRGSR